MKYPKERKKKPKRKKPEKVTVEFFENPLDRYTDEPVPDMYWEGEDGEGYKEDGCPWLFQG